MLKVISYCLYIKHKMFQLSGHLVVLEAEPRGVGIAAVVEEGHGGEDGPSHGDDVELGDVVVLEDALRHLQTICGSDLKMPGQ